MQKKRFEALVMGVLNALPAEFRSRLENVDVMVEDWPTPKQVGEARLGPGMQLLGLYEGIPQTKRGSGYNLVLPDKITIFQKPIERVCRNDREIEAEVQKVVRHEIAHHFGISDDALRMIEDKGP
jgi:predicted Zn-dependent protease with MMP-like domain